MEQTTGHGARRDPEDRLAEERWFDEGGRFNRYVSRFPDEAEDDRDRDNRWTPDGPPRRLEDNARYANPIEGEEDGIWHRAFHGHLAEQVRRQPELTGAEFFEKSLTIDPREIKFRFVEKPKRAAGLPRHDRVGHPAGKSNRGFERQRLDAAVAEVERELQERDRDIERALESWAERQPVDG